MSLATTFFDTRCLTAALIPNGTATTAEVDLGGTSLLGIVFPAAMTSTTCKIQMATVSGGTYQTLQSTSGTDLSFTFAQGKTMVFDTTVQAQLAAARFVKIVVAGNEGADRNISLISRTFS